MHMSKRPDPPPWPQYLRAAMDAARIDNAADLARRTGLNETQVSRWLRGMGQPSLANLRRMVATLGRPMLELAVAAGHLDPDEAEVVVTIPTGAPVPSVVEAVASDAELLPEAKEHLIKQYGLLLRVQQSPTHEESEETTQRKAGKLTSLAKVSDPVPTIAESPRPPRRSRRK